MNFDKAIIFVLAHEGGYVNDPNDPGGETNFGISKRAYPTLNIKNLTADQAKEIYLTDYWKKVDGNGCIDELALATFDTAVNCGVVRSIEIYNKANSLEEYLWLRARHYINIIKKRPELKRFLNGWMNRINDLYDYEMSEEK